MIPLAAGHRVLSKTVWPILQIGAQDFFGVTGQKSMDLDAQLAQVVLPSARQRTTQQYPGPFGNKLVAFFIDAQTPNLANCSLTIQLAETDQNEGFGRLEEWGNSLAAKWNGDFHDRGNDSDTHHYASAVPSDEVEKKSIRSIENLLL